MSSGSLAVPAQRHIAWVRCDLHRRPDPGNCHRCHVAMEITLRIMHERGQCGGPGFCEWCPEDI